MSHKSFVAKRTITVIAALSLFLAAVPIVANQKAFAANLCGSGLGCGGASDYGCDGCGGISYPSPLSNFFGGAASASIILAASITSTSCLMNEASLR